VKLVEEIGNFLWEIAKLAMLTEPHLVSADHLLPPQCTPTDVASSASSQMVGDLTPPLSSGPDIAADAQAAALFRVFSSFSAQVGPPPVRPERDLATLLSLVLPVIFLKAFIAVVNAGCTKGSQRLYRIMLYYYTLKHVFTLDGAAHETRRFFPPGVSHECTQRRISLIYVGPRSFHVNFVGSLGRLATAVDQAAPTHDLRR
jgi:hypothetical protein